MKLIITGESQSGKDTIGQMIAARRNGICIAQADPMKRFAAKVFGFSEETLWGPSAMRNQLVRNSGISMDEFWSSADYRLTDGAIALMDEVFPDFNHQQRNHAGEEIERWFEAARDSHGDDVSARVILQTLGTEWGRLIDPDMWNRWALRVSDSLILPGNGYDKQQGVISLPEKKASDLVVITDGRFRNEVAGTRSAGGLAIQVTDPNAPREGNVGVSGHRSEVEQRGIPRWWFHLTVMNDKTKGLDVLSSMIDSALNMLFPAMVVVWHANDSSSSGCNCDNCVANRAALASKVN